MKIIMLPLATKMLLDHFRKSLQYNKDKSKFTVMAALFNWVCHFRTANHSKVKS